MIRAFEVVCVGTNFYLNLTNSPEDMDDPNYHIGKRSAAGWYCWDCGITLNMGGESQIHKGTSGQYEKCPKCGNERTKDEGWGSAGVELGFNKPDKPDQRKGVRSVSSFTWAMSRSTLLRAVDESRVYKPIIDEYDRTYTYEEFEDQVLDNCPIRFNNMIGRWFS
jgi:hypothetical protein